MLGNKFFLARPIPAMKRPYGTGHIYEKSGAYYGRWRTPDGRLRNRRLGPIRTPGASDGLTHAMAERELRKAQESELAVMPVADDARGRTVDDAANALRDRLELQGARKSYRQNCESMQRVHISPAMGSRWVTEVTTADVEALARSMLRRGLAPKSVRNVITFLHSVFGLAVDRGWCLSNPVARAARPRRRRSGDASPDLQFLTVPELEAVIAAIPNEVVHRTPSPDASRPHEVPRHHLHLMSSVPCCACLSSRRQSLVYGNPSCSASDGSTLIVNGEPRARPQRFRPRRALERG